MCRNFKIGAPVLLGLLSSCGKGGGGESPVPVQKPNVVFILADDLGYGDISGLNPNSKIPTPNIDYLCTNGIVFTDAHATSALSTPSRYSIMTGRYPWRTTLKSGVIDGYASPMIAPGRKTIANLFSDNGYATACIGKWHLGWNWAMKKGAVDFTAPISNGPVDMGFDYFYGISASPDMPPYVYVEDRNATQIPSKTIDARPGVELMRAGEAAADYIPEELFPHLAAKTLNYIESRKGTGTPWFLYLPLTAPHTPILPSPEFKGKSPIGVYGDFVLMIDDLVGKITEKLRTNGQLDNTMIIFASDNGCASYIKIKDIESKGHYPSYVYRGYKTDIFEGGHRIPLIISWGSKYRNRKEYSLISLGDFYATFAQMFDHATGANEAEDSYSFRDILSSSGGHTARTDMVNHSGDGYFAMRTGQLKLIFTAGSGGDSYPSTPADMAGLPPLQLYDLNMDVGETYNIINYPQYRTDVETMTARIKQYVEEGRSTPGTPESNDTPNNWKQTDDFMK